MPTPDPPQLVPPRPRRTWPFRLWLGNVVLGAWIGNAWVEHAPPELSTLAWCFAHLALVSTIVFLSVVPYACVRLGVAWLPGRLQRWAHALVWSLFHLALFVDTRIYNLFRYHFNGMVWNVITAPDTGDSIQLSPSDWTWTGLGFAVLLGAEVAAASWLARLDDQRPEGAKPRPAILRPAWLWGVVLLPILLTEKALFAHADLERDAEITSLERLFPLYLGLTVKGLAEDLGMDFQSRPRVRAPARGVLLDYPKQPVVADPGGPRPNVLLIVIDSLRQDMLVEETMPHLMRFAEDARVFEDHASTGNATRFGVFGMLYGLHGPYWQQMYGERRSPVLVDTLLDAGYAAHAFSTASMHSPDFRSTAWVRMEDAVTDKIRVREKWQKDARQAEMVLEWVASARRPFFVFSFLDSPHQTYSFPTDDPPFRPYVGKIDYLRLSRDLDPETIAGLWNSYRNAVHHADSVVGRILSGLEEMGLLDDTVVMVTGDHGEEFGENGFWGHTSNFTREQVCVPFVLRGPGIEPGFERRPTSHLDVPATLLELIGVDPALRASYSLGGNLLQPDPDALRVASGWDTMGLWTAAGIVTVPFEAHRGFSRLHGYDWNVVYDDDAALQASSGSLLRLMKECGRFLR